MTKKIHPARLLVRKPYKLLLCSLANLVVILFTVVEGLQLTGTRAAMEKAMENRFYTGTVTRAAESENGAGYSGLFRNEDPVGEDAVAILEASPCVEKVEFAVTHTARFGGGKRCVAGDAASYAMIVGRVTGEPYVVGNSARYPNRVRFRPTYLAAGDPDAVRITFAEYAVFPTMMFPPMDEPPAYHHGERYFIFGLMPHETHSPADGIYMDFKRTQVFGEEPGDEALSDEEFARKIMEKHGLGPYAERLEGILDMTAVVEIPSLDMLLPWRNNLMRVVSGRALTEKDAGKKVCMCPLSLLNVLRKRVGETLLLSLADGVSSASVGRSGVPTIFTESEPLDFGTAEEYEIVGSYKNDEGWGIDADTAYFYLGEILIPAPADRAYVPVLPYLFSFTVRKDDYESYLFETETLLAKAGYRVVMARPDYADVEKDFEELQSKTLSTFLTAGIALAVGLLIAAGSLILFWRSDYIAERRLGAKKREAAGLYFRAFGVVAAVSLALSALGILAIGKTKLVPFLAPENLSAGAWGSMALFAAAELVLYALVVIAAVLVTDRRRFGG